MTTQYEMELAYGAQRQVISALRSIGEIDLAARLEGCMMARRERHGGDGWPKTCRSAGCIWCRRALMRGWWAGMGQWAAGSMASLATIPLNSSAGLRAAVHRLRRGLRDVRDRMARRRYPWRDVGFAGLGGGDSVALVMVSHQGIDRGEVLDALCRRWPEVMLKNLDQEAPTWAMAAEDAADLARHGRGVEPLRIAIMPQRNP